MIDDNDLRRRMNEAFAAADKANADCDDFLQRRYEEQHRQQRVVVRTYEPQRIAQRVPEQTASDDWNAWAAKLIDDRLSTYTEQVLTEAIENFARFVGGELGTLKRELRKEIAELRNRIAQLEVEKV